MLSSLRRFIELPITKATQTRPLCATPFAIPISFSVADQKPELLLQEVYSSIDTLTMKRLISTFILLCGFAVQSFAQAQPDPVATALTEVRALINEGNAKAAV